MAWLLSILTTTGWTFDAFDGRRRFIVEDAADGLRVAQGPAKPSKDMMRPLALSGIKSATAAERALHDADAKAISGDLNGAFHDYIEAALSFSGDYGDMAAATALELSARLGVPLAKKKAARFERRTELAGERAEGLALMRRHEVAYRVARTHLARGEAAKAVQLLNKDTPTETPLRADVRRQALLDQALREWIVGARNDYDQLARLWAGYGEVVQNHGDARWLETFIAEAFVELDMPEEAVRVLARSPSQQPIVARELLAARAALDAHLPLSAGAHLKQLEALVTDDRGKALVQHLLKQLP